MTRIVPGAVVVEKGGQRKVLYDPLPHQKEMHASTARFTLVEGGRGSGKSTAIRWHAYQMCMAIPRFRALIVRRTMPELEQSHLGFVPFEANQLGLADNAWHTTLHVLRFENGSTLRFGHAQDDAALAKYLSSEYELIGLDELATFSLRQFFFLCSSLRSPIKGYVPCALAGTNPVGPGAGWVKRFFIDKNPSKIEAPEYDASEYKSIHSTMDDNPHIDRVAYDKILSNLPSEALRKALRHGEWVVEGQAFGEWTPQKVDRETLAVTPWHVIDTLPTYRGRPIIYEKHIEIVRVLDWGYAATGNPGACIWFACLPDGSAIAFKEWYFSQTLPADVAAGILARSEGMKVRYTVGDTAMWQEHEGPSIAESLAAAGLPMIEADKQRIPGWVQVHKWLRTTIATPDGREHPMIRFLRPSKGLESPDDLGCPNAIRTIPEMVCDPNDPEDIVTRGVEDEAADLLRYFVMSRPSASREPKADPKLQWILNEIAKRRRRNNGRLGTEATRRR